MARTIPDLDPADHATRDALRRQLRDLRISTGVTQRALADRIGSVPANVRRLERQGVLQSRTSTIARWARGLDHELVPEPVGLPAPVSVRRPSRSRDADQILAMIVQSAGLTGDDWLGARLVADLTGIRVAAGVTQARLAARLGLTEQAVSFMEAAHADTALVVLQRYARAVALCSRWRSGYLSVRLEPIVHDPQLTVDSRSVDTPQLIPST